MQRYIIGKYILLFMLFISMNKGLGTVQLSIVQSDGRASTCIPLNSLCTLKIVCQGQGPMSFPTVEGLNAFRVESRSNTVSIINGVTKTIYMFKIRALEEGSYTIGPSYITINGKTETSNTITVTIVPEQMKPVQSSQEDRKLFIELHTDTTSVVLGQNVQGTLTVHYRVDTHTTVEHLETPQWPELGIEVEQTPLQGKEILNGIEYIYYTWHWKVRPKRVGTFVIPPCTASCQIPFDGEDDDIFSRFSSMFTRLKRVPVSSNSLHISVKDLPDSSQKIHGVGVFNTIQGYVNDTTIKCQEATTLYIKITGDDSIESYTLCALPEAVRWYEGKKTVHYNEQIKKTETLFEFVIQGLEEGTYTIPQQSLYFFDPQENTYKMLSTQPMSLTIIPNPLLQQNPIDPQRINNKFSSIQEVERSDIWEREWNSERSVVVMPWYFFWLSLIVSTFIYIALLGRSYWSKGTGGRRSKRNVIQQTKQLLHGACKEGHAFRVYGIFVDFWAQYLNISHVRIDEEYLMGIIQSTNMSHKQKEEWADFVARMISRAYADRTQHDEQFFKEACAWIDRITAYL